MNSTLKEHWGCLTMILLFIGFIIFLFFVNNHHDNKQPEPTLGKYIYLDINETLHARRHCPAIGKQAGELGSSDRTVTRIPVEKLTFSMLDYCCSRCVSDASYERFQEIIQANDTSLTPPSRRKYYE